jgi:hypothetical protein
MLCCAENSHRQPGVAANLKRGLGSLGSPGIRGSCAARPRNVAQMPRHCVWAHDSALRLRFAAMGKPPSFIESWSNNLPLVGVDVMCRSF